MINADIRAVKVQFFASNNFFKYRGNVKITVSITLRKNIAKISNVTYLTSPAPKREITTEVTPANIYESPSPKVSVFNKKPDNRLKVSSNKNDMIIPNIVYKTGKNNKLHFVIPNFASVENTNPPKTTLYSNPSPMRKNVCLSETSISLISVPDITIKRHIAAKVVNNINDKIKGDSVVFKIVLKYK